MIWNGSDTLSLSSKLVSHRWLIKKKTILGLGVLPGASNFFSLMDTNNKSKDHSNSSAYYKGTLYIYLF